MANTQKNTIENVINEFPIPSDGKEALRTFYGKRGELKKEIVIDLASLKTKVAQTAPKLQKAVIVEGVSGIEVAKKTDSWKTFTPEEKTLIETPAAAVPVNKEDQPHSHDESSHESHEKEVTSLRREIDNLIQSHEYIRSVDGPRKFLETLSSKLNEPDVTPAAITAIQSQLHDLQSALSNFTPNNAQDIIEKINNYQESREEKTNEGNLFVFSAIVHEIYRLGFRMKFMAGDTIVVTGGTGNEAANLSASFAGKKNVIEWLKRGMVANTTAWGDYMSSYPSKDTATVDKYISTYGKKRFAGKGVDKDFLDSSTSGGFDTMGPDGKWVTRGMNIHSIAEASQQASKKWKEMGYQTPMQAAGGAPVQFAEMAYNVAKIGFAAASVWKGSKALWKTIFSDEAGMKAAWGDFGKTLAWTGAVWYGGEAVKRFSNDIKSNIDNPNYVDSLKEFSRKEGKSGMYDGFVSIYKKIGGGPISGIDGKMTGILEGFMPSTVPAHQFKAMWETLCIGNQGDKFLNTRISDLKKALENKYHSEKNGEEALGSHVGGLREFFYDMGPSGKDIYDKFLIDDRTGDNARKFLEAIADYRREDSFKGANDAIPNRDQTIATLFETPLAKKTEVPGNIDPKVKEMSKAWREAGYSVLNLGVTVGTFIGDAFHVVVDGAVKVVELPKEMLKDLDPATKEQLGMALSGLLLAGLAIGGISLIPGGLGMGGAAVKILIGGAAAGGLYYLFMKGRGLVDDLNKKMDLMNELIKNAKGVGEEAKKQAEDFLKKNSNATADFVKKGLEALGIPPQTVEDLLDIWRAHESGNTPSPLPPSPPENGPPPEKPVSERMQKLLKDDKWRDDSTGIKVTFKDSPPYTKKSDLSNCLISEILLETNEVSKKTVKFDPTPPTDPDLLELYTLLP